MGSTALLRDDATTEFSAFPVGAVRYLKFTRKSYLCSCAIVPTSELKPLPPTATLQMELDQEHDSDTVSHVVPSGIMTGTQIQFAFERAKKAARKSKLRFQNDDEINRSLELLDSKLVNTNADCMV
jgi:hypothetical protein